MMDDFLKIECPGCRTVLVVNRRTGKIVEQRKPILEESSGDRFEDAFEKVRQSKKLAEEKFNEARRKEKDRKSKIESLFNENLKRVKESGDVSKPHRDMDLD